MHCILQTPSAKKATCSCGGVFKGKDYMVKTLEHVVA